MSFHTLTKIFGFTDQSNIGMITWPSYQIAASFSSAYPHLFRKKGLCLIPYAIDQDPYFRLGRDVAKKLKCCCRGASSGGGQGPLLVALVDLRTERDHVELPVHDGADDMSALRIHDGIAIDELGVVELRSEVQSGGAIGQLLLCVLIMPAVIAVERREHVTVVERGIIDIRNHQVLQWGHRPAVMPDGA